MYVVHIPNYPDTVIPYAEKHGMEATWLQNTYTTTKAPTITNLVLFLRDLQLHDIECGECTVFEMKTVTHFKVTA